MCEVSEHCPYKPETCPFCNQPEIPVSSTIDLIQSDIEVIIEESEE